MLTQQGEQVGSGRPGRLVTLRPVTERRKRGQSGPWPVGLRDRDGERGGVAEGRRHPSQDVVQVAQAQSSWSTWAMIVETHAVAT